MSGDMLTNLLDENTEFKKETYKELELKKWNKFKEKCFANYNTILESNICRHSGLTCNISQCHAKQIKTAIENGTL